MLIDEESKMEEYLSIDDYPQLALLGWNRKVRKIAQEEAFALYEANWRFVEQSEMTVDERLLVKRLMEDYGRGVMNV